MAGDSHPKGHRWFAAAYDRLTAHQEHNLWSKIKPDGTFRFIEHVRHDDGLGGRLQDLATPVWRWFAAGCHLNRRTGQSISEAGFEVVEERRFTIPPGMPVLVGVAKPA